MSIYSFRITIDKVEIIVRSQEAARLSAWLVTQYGAKLISAPRSGDMHVKLTLDLPTEPEKRGFLSGYLSQVLEAQRESSAPNG